MQQLQRANREAFATPYVQGHLAGPVDDALGREQQQRVVQLAHASAVVELMQHDVPIIRLGLKLGLELGHLGLGVLLGARRLDLRLAVHHVGVKGEDATAHQERARVLKAVIEERTDDVGHLPQLFFLRVLEHAEATHGDALVLVALFLGRQAKQQLVGLHAHMLAKGGDLVLDGFAVVVAQIGERLLAEHAFGVQDRPQEANQAVSIEREGRQAGRAQRGAYCLAQLVHFLHQLGVTERAGLGDGEQQADVLHHVVVIGPKRLALGLVDVLHAPLGQLLEERRGLAVVHRDVALIHVGLKLVVQHRAAEQAPLNPVVRRHRGKERVEAAGHVIISAGLRDDFKAEGHRVVVVEKARVGVVLVVLEDAVQTVEARHLVGGRHGGRLAPDIRGVAQHGFIPKPGGSTL